MNRWYVYILQCADHSLYTGTTTDPDRRLHEHNHDDRLGAAYTRGRRPVCLLYKESCPDRSAALRRERAIRKLRREEKLLLAGYGQ
ncbi:MAG TPA: GIY-YIG nuclease family protein [Gammaproteobacteria bacterium]|nr:GIY-YIG nuclease family protein [Gammaproteobacteria bacterium]